MLCGAIGAGVQARRARCVNRPHEVESFQFFDSIPKYFRRPTKEYLKIVCV